MDDNPATQDSKTLASYKQGDGGAEVVGLENRPCAAQDAAQEDLGDGTASGHRRNGDGFYGFGVSAARRFKTASAVWRRREEAEGSAESAAAVSARVEGVEEVEEVEGGEGVEEVARAQSSRTRRAVVREEEG